MLALLVLMGNHMNRAHFIALLVTSVSLACGCTTTRTSDTARTGIEQMLISNAIDQAVSATRLTCVRDRNVYIDEAYLDCTDKQYLVGSLRNRVLDNGGRLVQSVDDADIVMEVRSGGVGTDNTDKYVGIPGLAVPGVPLEIPEVRLWEQNSQFGTAKIAVTCFDTKSGQQLESSGNLLARSDNSRWSVLGYSTGDTGTVNQELAQATSQRPMSFAAPLEAMSNEVIANKPQSWR